MSWITLLVLALIWAAMGAVDDAQEEE